MKVGVVDDPKDVRVVEGYYQRDSNHEFVLDADGHQIWIEGECRVLRQDVEAGKEFAKEVMKEDNMRIRQEWEHAYYADLKERYGSAQVAGAMLMKVWDWTKGKK